MRELSVKEGQALALTHPPEPTKQACQVESPRLAGRTFVCTLVAHHQGDHIAHAPGPLAVATWR